MESRRKQTSLACAQKGAMKQKEMWPRLGCSTPLPPRIKTKMMKAEAAAAIIQSSGITFSNAEQTKGQVPLVSNPGKSAAVDLSCVHKANTEACDQACSVVTGLPCCHQVAFAIAAGKDITDYMHENDKRLLVGSASMNQLKFSSCLPRRIMKPRTTSGTTAFASYLRSSKRKDARPRSASWAFWNPRRNEVPLLARSAFNVGTHSGRNLAQEAPPRKRATWGWALWFISLTPPPP